MMRFLSSLMKAMRGAFGGIWSFVTWPLTWFGGGGSQSAAADVPRPPRAKAPAAPGLTPEELDRAHKRTVSQVRGWILSTLDAGAHQCLPPGLPRGVASWLPGLSTSQLVTLSRSGIAGISAHIGGVRPVEGVPSVRALPVARLDAVPPERDDESFKQDLRAAYALC
ncbi:hypothetical protein FIU28_17395 [Tardiphaga sp. vice154]|uniref:hypothetical protein n=1 Tax=Tardiphaga sp. vice154 TaxID=2592814 RepID=UPI001164AA15|nr:hypothetical protein [Tardiphaga sp. vice154]QDM22727.1 hypothetical protein FIU28_17395 [Tardiphaga sp. vice154]